LLSLLAAICGAPTEPNKVAKTKNGIIDAAMARRDCRRGMPRWKVRVAIKGVGLGHHGRQDRQERREGDDRQRCRRLLLTFFDRSAVSAFGWRLPAPRSARAGNGSA